MAISRIRHLVWRTLPDARNASADEKASTAKPSSFSRSGRDSRTDSSSSTTEIIGRSSFIHSSGPALRAWGAGVATAREDFHNRNIRHTFRPLHNTLVSVRGDAMHGS